MIKNTKKNSHKKYNIAIWGSGKGSLVEPIYNYSLHSRKFELKLIASNKKNAGILQRSRELQIEQLLLKNPEETLKIHKQLDIKLIVLAGYLRKVPPQILREIPVINIHPSLIPNFSGKNMFGENVHKRVSQEKLNFSGITIHFANEEYDEGAIIYQKAVALTSGNYEQIQKKVNYYERLIFPMIIEYCLDILY